MLKIFDLEKFMLLLTFKSMKCQTELNVSLIEEEMNVKYIFLM